jgi:hypothetical protein
MLRSTDWRVISDNYEDLLPSKSGYLSFYIACPSLLNPLHAELNPICHLLALLGAQHILHISRIRVNYLLTYSMQQCPAWEANMFSASQELTHILWIRKVHHRVYYSPTPVSILSQINPVLALTPFIFSRSILILTCTKSELSIPFLCFYQTFCPCPKAHQSVS